MKSKSSKKITFFSYKKGNSFLHKIPAWQKILFIPVLNVLIFCLPIYFTFGFILFQIVLAFAFKFTLREQYSDLKFVLYYALILILLDLISFFSLGNFDIADFFSWNRHRESIYSLSKIFCVMQSASLFFKTSTSLELRDGIEKIETAIRKFFHLKNKNRFTNGIFMFLNFIPMIAKIWEQNILVWRARGGKKGIRMYLKLLPILFSVGMKKAYNVARAISIREA